MSTTTVNKADLALVLPYAIEKIEEDEAFLYSGEYLEGEEQYQIEHNQLDEAHLAYRRLAGYSPEAD